MKNFFQNIVAKIWEGILQNLGVLITAFVFSGGYLIAINKLKEFQSIIRSIPSDYFLTPLILLLVIFFVLVKINRKQHQQLSEFKKEPAQEGSASQLVTHLGVWWKVYPENEYIEDFPYCSCCDPKIKLVQFEWDPSEKYRCPKTGTEYQLFDKVPRDREKVLESLYNAYFKGLSSHISQQYFAEHRKLKELKPELSQNELSKQLFKLEPFCFIPESEVNEILTNNPDPIQAYYFVDRNFTCYNKYFKKSNKNQCKEKKS